MNYQSHYKFSSDISNVFKKDILKFTQNKRVLDLGCGDGSYLELFGNGSLGLDISENNLKTCKDKDLNAIKFDFNNPNKLDEKFDVVFVSHILEHVESPIKLIRFAKEHLSENGIIIIAIPNEYSFIHLVYPYYTNDGNHLYSFSMKNMKELFEVCNLNLTNIYYDYYTSLTTKLGINKILTLLDLFPTSMKLPFAWAHWYIATNKNTENSTEAVTKAPVDSNMYDHDYYIKYNHGYSSYEKDLSVMPDIKNYLDKVDFRNKKVLDVACGRGEVLKYIIEHNGIAIGMDYSKDAIEYSKNTLSKAEGPFKSESKALVMDAKKLEFEDNTFDIAVMLDIVEHLHDWELTKAMNEVSRVLKKDGILLIHTTPNKFLLILPTIVSKLFGDKLKSQEFHVNEQTYFKLNSHLIKHFKGNFILHKDKNYWYNQMVFRPQIFKSVAKVVDFCFDNRISDYIIKNTFMKIFLATDIWYIGKNKK